MRITRRAGGSRDERLHVRIPRASLAWGVGCGGHRWRPPGLEQAGQEERAEQGQGPDPTTGRHDPSPPQCGSGPAPCFSLTSSSTGFNISVSQTYVLSLSPGPLSAMWTRRPHHRLLLLLSMSFSERPASPKPRSGALQCPHPREAGSFV